MPKKVERALRIRATLLYPNNIRRQDTYVYGALRNMGLMPKRKK